MDERKRDSIIAYLRSRMAEFGITESALAELEGEQTSWVPGQGPSPNRVEALVHAGTDLLKRLEPAAIASPNNLLRRAPRHLRAVS